MYYHLPLKHWVRALFSQPELVPFLHLFQEATPPPGSVRLSNGFHEKAIGNPDINSESRNQVRTSVCSWVELRQFRALGHCSALEKVLY